ncbi:SNF2-related protein [Halomonas sp. I5-271120]|uniref:SNF2-related protein n=1 Tax=Halomonas sp. I5-271120 TaxID=3061632 RepID=UPI0027152196|nr:SNF2-related protein [Halomonas sp. I5-271120]
MDDAGYRIDIQHAGMQDVVLGRYSAALINPPFSIPLASPNLTPYEGVTHYGRHGPNTSALSHEYALAQALAHADIVGALLPRTTTNRLLSGEFGEKAYGRLRAVYSLPSDTFSAEQVEAVTTDLLVFGSHRRSASQAIVRERIDQDSQPAGLGGLSCRTEAQLGAARIRLVDIDDTGPAITTPVTGDPRVTMTRAGRAVKLVFRDGATEARVLNALMMKQLISTHHHRYPAKTHYAGQLRLSLDVIAMQEDPGAALDELADMIESAGGQPEVTAQLRNGLASVVHEHRKMSVPYGRVVYRKGAPDFRATARKMGMINRQQRGAAVAPGEEVQAQRTEQGFNVTTPRGVFQCEHDAFLALFEIEEDAAGADYWEEVHPPIKARFPQQIAQLERRAKARGLDQWLTWDFQLEDLCELAFRPRGGICGWQMALGKTRLALALAILLEGPSLIVVKSRLVDELYRELETLGVPESSYQAIEGAGDTHELRKVNIISYDRLKRPLDPRLPKLTLAKRLKGRISNVICDEGGVLSNLHSQQTRALWQLGGRRRYAFDGTPMANYPREMLPLASWAVGEERSYQPYSVSGGHLDAAHFRSAEFQQTGRQAFLDHFVTFEWATNEFLDSGVGAKREIPKIRSGNVPRFRQWIGPQIKRRVQQEPAVAKHVAFPVPTLHEPISIDWDLDHLMLYVEAVEDFANWYREYAREQDENGKALNLTVILARLEACFKAANAPHTVSGFSRPYHPLTSKQRACIEMVEKEVAKGRRPIVFARSPSVLSRLSKELGKRGVSNLVFTGKETIKRRMAKLNANIREGDAQVMLASLGVTQDGLNLPQLNTFIFYNRSFKSRQEFQAIYRLIRPTQDKDVYGYFLHMAGSIDEYQGQLIEWKMLASEAGLDYGEAISDESEFVHFDAFFRGFIETLPDLKAQIEAMRGQQVA